MKYTDEELKTLRYARQLRRSQMVAELRGNAPFRGTVGPYVPPKSEAT